MEKLIMLGTGYVNAVKCYNSCFAIQDEDGYMLVDGGGGNGILKQLSDAGISPGSIHGIYLSQGAPNSLFGVMWVIKAIGEMMRSDQYEGDLKVYCQSELVKDIHTIANITLPRRFIWLFDHRIVFVPLYDGDVRNVMGHETQFFYIKTGDIRQLGFAMTLENGERFVFSGEGLLPEDCFVYAQGADWLLHEAYCLHSQKDIYKPYEAGRCTVRDACETAAHLGIPNLILTGTEEDNISRRSDLYTAEARLYYKGRVFVPDDLGIVELAA